MSEDRKLEQIRDIKLEKLKLLEEKAKLHRNLPHLYGFKDYKWSREFLDSTNKTLLLTAANQLGKSTTLVRKVIDYATDVNAWPSRFRRTPRQFWYLYPTAQVASAEFHTKWKTDILPRDEMKDHPQYGWKAEFKNRGDISAIYFNSGVALYFKTYAQDASHLQSGTVDFVACFTGENLVSTEHGQKRIDEVKVGDRVWTKEGRLQRVYGVKSRHAEVITRQFSDGSKITATPDHKFWVVGYGWKDFSKLTHDDELYMSPIWANLEGQKKSLLTAECIADTPTRMTENIGIFDAHQVKECTGEIKERILFYTEMFGNFLMAPFLMGFQYITKITTQVIMIFLTLFYYIKKTTRIYMGFIGGALGILVFPKKVHAFGVASYLKLHPVKNLQKYFAPKNAGHFTRVKIENANGVQISTGLREKIKVKDFVQQDVLPKTEKLVFCLQVEEDHNFFVNNICVKNCDEELPETLFDEIQFRRNAVEGYFASVFTATLGQEMWRLAMEPKKGEKEFLPFAHKIRASLFDCQYFLDGSPSHWTLEKINRTIALCRSESEVLKRVYGRFVKDEGLKYPSFDRSRNVKPPEPPPPHWPIYVGVDIGAGGDENHPSAITFVAVRPDYRYGVVFRHWRGDDKIYTMSDVANKYIELSQDINVTAAFYDYHAKDFKTITDRMGLSFAAAEKKHDIGEQVINVLFKNSMLDIHDSPEMVPLISEITSLLLGTDKRKAKDDSVDSMRYALTKIPFDFSHVGYQTLQRDTARPRLMTPHEVASSERNRDRIRMFASQSNVSSNQVQDEISEWNQVFGASEDFYDADGF